MVDDLNVKSPEVVTETVNFVTQEVRKLLGAIGVPIPEFEKKETSCLADENEHSYRIWDNRTIDIFYPHKDDQERIYMSIRFDDRGQVCWFENYIYVNGSEKITSRYIYQPEGREINVIVERTYATHQECTKSYLKISPDQMVYCEYVPVLKHQGNVHDMTFQWVDARSDDLQTGMPYISLPVAVFPDKGKLTEHAIPVDAVERLGGQIHPIDEKSVLRTIIDPHGILESTERHVPLEECCPWSNIDLNRDAFRHVIYNKNQRTTDSMRIAWLKNDGSKDQKGILFLYHGDTNDFSCLDIVVSNIQRSKEGDHFVNITIDGVEYKVVLEPYVMAMPPSREDILRYFFNKGGIRVSEKTLMYP